MSHSWRKDSTGQPSMYGTDIVKFALFYVCAGFGGDSLLISIKMQVESKHLQDGYE